jgi:MoaA/NifB/PqqE/SkfB family radical SAM enzyme
MIVSLNPTYLCNFRCNFCYLTREQLADKSRIDLSVLEKRLKEINDYQPIEMVDLYGGEIGLLDHGYLLEMDALIKQYTDDINIITNLYKIHPYFSEGAKISVSWDHTAREKSDVVLNNILLMSDPVSILMLASPEFVKFSPEEVMEALEPVLNVVESIEIKPYSRNQANDLFAGDLEYEDCIERWIEYSQYATMPHFENKSRIERSLNKEYNAFSDSHIYIQPDGTLAVLDFDQDRKEYFRPMNHMTEYAVWSKMEKFKVRHNPICSKCEYSGHCLTEHYREVKEGDASCSGFRNLLDWSKAYL